MALFFDYEGVGEDFEFELSYPSPMSSVVGESSSKVTSTVLHPLDQVSKIVQKQQNAIALDKKKPANMRFMDKLSFTLGVLNIAVASFLWGRWPEYAYIAYSVKFVVLLGLRVINYRQTGDHYFMFDFCYFANAWIMAYLWIFPNSCMMFHTAFSFTHGPLVWAIAAWRNSMVFHSLDKTTSVFIHYTPTILMWAMRSSPDPQFNTCQDEYPTSLPFTTATLWPFVPYLVWQILYAIKVEYVDHEKIEKRGLTTSFRFMSTSKGTLMYKLIHSQGKQRWKQVSIFMLVQVVYTFLTTLLVGIWWRFVHVGDAAFLVAIGALCCWNGANFYFEVFSKRYEAQMSRNAEQWKAVADALQGAAADKKQKAK